MNRNFENRKPTKVYAKSKENQMIIKALNMYGRVPEMWELLKEIERLNNIIKEALNYIDYNTYYKDHKGHINIDDLYMILQKGSDKE